MISVSLTKTELASENACMSDESPGAIIRRARQESGMKQRDLAERLGVHHTTVGYWERNKFFPEQHWARLNKLLGIDLRPPGGPASGPPEQPTISAKLLAEIRKELPDPEDQKRVIELIERRLRGEPPPSASAQSGESDQRAAG